MGELKVSLSVFRRLDNRSEGLQDDSPRALELHERRKLALHEALDGNGAWSVDDWGNTDSKESHELVDIALSVFLNPHLQAIAASAAAWIGLEIAKAALGEFESEAVKALLARLLPKQKEEKIQDFTITLKDGTRIKADQGKLDIRRRD